jgi:polyferredoxin
LGYPGAQVYEKGSRAVAMSRKNIWLGLLALLALFLVIAWYDGGREPQRLIEQPVELPDGVR